MTGEYRSLMNTQSRYTEEEKPIVSRLSYVNKLITKSNFSPLVDLTNGDITNYKKSLAKLNIKEHDFEIFLRKLGVKLEYISSGSYGHVFKVMKNDKVICAMKLTGYTRKRGNDDVNDSTRAENVEINIYRAFSYFVVKKLTPHLILPVYHFKTNIRAFVNSNGSVFKSVENSTKDDKKKESYLDFVKSCKNNSFHSKASVLLYEYAEKGDLRDYIKNNRTTMTTEKWKVIIFQYLLTLAQIQKEFPTFKHNDSKPNNILVKEIPSNFESPSFKYNLGKQRFVVPNIGIQICLADFDFSCIHGLFENGKVNSSWANNLCINNTPNLYYDMHFFLTNLISSRFFQQGEPDSVIIPDEIIDFVHRVVPEPYMPIDSKDLPFVARPVGFSDRRYEELKETSIKEFYIKKRKRISHKGRLIDPNLEVTCPLEVLMLDKLFKDYRQIAINYKS